MIWLVYELRPEIGSGHYMRCKSIQETLVEFFDAETILVNEREFIVNSLEESDIVIYDLFSTERTSNLINQTSPYCFVATLDYFSNEAKPELNISVLEQFNEKRKHKNFVGLQYSVLRPDFLKFKPSEKIPNTIFVYIGGTGFPEIIQQIVDIFKNSAYHFNLIRNQNSVETGPLPENFVVHKLPENLIQLMDISDFAITSPGLTTLELLYLQVPSILCPLIPYHEKFTDFLIEEGLAISRLSNFRPELLANLNSLRETAKQKVDGQGTSRIIQTILNEYAKKMGRNYALRD